MLPIATGNRCEGKTEGFAVGKAKLSGYCPIALWYGFPVEVLQFFSMKSKSVKDTLTKPKEAHEILSQLTEEAVTQYKRKRTSLFLSAFSAGLEISFSVLLMGVVFSLYNGRLSEPAMHTLLAICYPLGFLFVILGKSELFTEHTTVAVLPVLTGQIAFPSLLKLWSLVLMGNFAGVFLFSLLLSTLPVNMHIILPEAYLHIATNILDYRWYNIVGSSLLAGWLMGLLGWLVTSASDTISRIFIIVIVTFVIGISGLHHSIVGAAEVMTAAWVSAEVSYKDVIRFLGLSVPGNIIGGAIFVAALKRSNTPRENFDVEKEE